MHFIESALYNPRSLICLLRSILVTGKVLGPSGPTVIPIAAPLLLNSMSSHPQLCFLEGISISRLNSTIILFVGDTLGFLLCNVSNEI